MLSFSVDLVSTLGLCSMYHFPVCRPTCVPDTVAGLSILDHYNQWLLHRDASLNYVQPIFIFTCCCLPESLFMHIYHEWCVMDVYTYRL